MATTLDDIYQDVRALLLGLFSCEVIRGYSNNVPMPKPPFILMNILQDSTVATNEHNYSVIDGTATISRVHQINMQLDFYGTTAATMAQTVSLLWRDYYACEQLKHCQPLYTNEARFMPLTNEESHYESRWSLIITLAYHPLAIHQQSFVNDFDIHIIQP